MPKQVERMEIAREGTEAELKKKKGGCRKEALLNSEDIRRFQAHVAVKNRSLCLKNNNK